MQQDIPNGFRLSPPQRHLLSLYQIDKDNHYLAQCIIHISGQIELHKLEIALGRVIQTYEIFRTNFCGISEAAAVPLQVIQEHAAFSLDYQDLSQLNAEAQSEQVKIGYKEEGAVSFDFSSGILLKAKLLKLATNQFALLICLPAFCADSTTLKFLTREIGRTYSKEVDLEDDPLQYADVAEWLNEVFLTEEGKAGAVYWQQNIPDQLHSQKFPYEKEGESAFVPQSISISLPDDVIQKGKAIAAAHETNISMLILTVWQTLLSRNLDQTDLVVGVAGVGRYYEELEAVLGPLTKFLPFHCPFSSKEPLRTALTKVQELLNEVTEWQECFDWEQLAIKNHSNSSFFPFSFEFLDLGEPFTLSEGITFSIAHLYAHVDRFKIKLTCLMWDNDALELIFYYDANIFHEENIHHMVSQFTAFIEKVIESPETSTAYIPILGNGEYRKLIDEVNRTGVDYPQNKCIHQFFEEQVALTPHRVALYWHSQVFTYSELNRQANRLAHYLRRLGISSEERVAICLDRSPQMLIALLGVLKAGGTYAPLSPSSPQERLQYMLQDLDPAILIYQGESAFVPDHIRTVSLDSEAICLEQTDDPEITVTPNHLAYILYTSGSTGYPKGVMITHRNLVNYLNWCIDTYGSQLDQISVVHSPISFDLTVTSLYVPLLTGRSIMLLPEVDVLENLGTIWQNGIEPKLLKMTPAHLKAMSQLINISEMRSASGTLVLGGEQLLAEDIKSWHETVPGLTIYNEYGPTEATVGCCVYEVVVVDSTAVPIGKPIANVQLYLLDAHLQPVPIGNTGELYIGGAGLARGYRNQPALTATAFIPDPFGEQFGGRIYKTGDLARFQPGLELAFSGRNDHQVKLRGFRIELGEIETVLKQHPALCESIVLVREEASGASQLVAYVVPDEADHEPERLELQAYLKNKLPDYMIPAKFVFLHDIPLTSNAKVDREALQALPTDPQRSAAPFIAAGTAVEKSLAKIWARLLQKEEIGIHDNFFKLGGDSILSIQVVSRARQEGLYFALSDMFAHQTIAELASIVQTERVVETEQGMVTGALPLTPIQHWFFKQQFDEPSHWNQALTIMLDQPLNVEWLGQALAAVIKHHDVLRLRFQYKADKMHQVHAAYEESWPLHHFDLSSVPLDQQKADVLNIQRDLQMTLDIAQGPLFRAAYIDQGSQQYLSIAIHHLTVDAVSWQIILEDLETAYLQLSQAAPLILPAKTSSFQQWSHFIHAFTQTINLEETLAYWEKATVVTIPKLPIDFDNGLQANTNKSARTVRISFTKKESQALLQAIVGLDKITINDVLLTALVYTLSCWTGAEGFWIEMEGHGREDLTAEIDVSRTVGWFTSLFPVLFEVRGCTEIGSLIKTVKEQLHRLPGNGFYYGLLRFLQEESADRLSRLPAPEISFNYLGHWGHHVGETALYKNIDTATPSTRSPQALRSHLLAIDGILTQEQLHIEWTYSQHLHRRETIQNLAQYFMTAIRLIIDYSQSAQGHTFTSVDYPLAHLTQSQLDKLISVRGLSEWRNNIEDMYELSPAQQGMFFQSLYSQERGTHIEQLYGIFEGELQFKAFRAAWQQLIRKHTALRTSFYLGELDKPVQLVHRQVEVPLIQYDWTAFAKTEQDEQFHAFLRAEREKGFDMQAPLLRLALFKIAERTHLFVVTFHHILVDGWSTALVFNDVFTLYKKFKKEPDWRFLERAAPYKDYIAWLQSQDLDEAEIFWRQYLKGYQEPIILTNTRDNLLALTYHQDTYQLSEDVTKQLKSFAKAHQITVNSVIQAAWGIILSRYSHKDDVTFGVTVAGRPAELPGVETMVGLFINTLPVRIRVSRAWSVSDFVSQHQQAQFKLHQYFYTPLTQVQKWSEVAAGVPLFDHILVFENFPKEKRLHQSPGDLKIREGSDITARTNYPLVIIIIPNASLTFQFVYYSHLWQPESIHAVFEDFKTVLTSMFVETMTIEALLDQVSSSLPLYKPAADRQVTSSVIVPPKTLTESKLAKIWCQVLGLEQVSIFDNILNLGGHSLLIVQIASQMRDAFQVDLPLRTFFEYPILTELAEQIDEARRHHVPLKFPPIESVSRQEKLPLSYAQERLWIINQIEPDNIVYNIPIAVVLKGKLDKAALKRSFHELFRRHEVLRTRYDVVDEVPIQVIMTPNDIKIDVVDLSDTAKNAQSLALEIAEKESKRPFDLRTAPPLRLTLYELGDNNYLLHIVIHHIAVDAWSMRIFMGELITLYNAHWDGKLSLLPDLSVQYADYAYWERTWLTEETLEAPLDYWKKQLSGELPTLNLPTDHPRPKMWTYQGARETRVLSQSTLTSLQAFSQQQEVTTFVTLLAVFKTLLYRYTRQNDMVVGLDIANRFHKQTEGLIGFFINQSVLRSFLFGHYSFHHLLMQIRQAIYEGWTFEDVPFNLLVKSLTFKRDASRPSLFQVKMDYVQIPTVPPPLSDLTMDFVEVSTGEEELELILFVTEQPDTLNLSIGYSTDLFEAATIQGFLANFETILNQAIQQPEILLDNLILKEKHIKRGDNMKQKKTQKRKSLKSFTPQTVQISPQEMVKVGALRPEWSLPLMIEPAMPGVEIVDWMKSQHDWIEEKLLKHGALLLRGFELGTVDRFEAMATCISSDLFHENGEHTPVSADGSIQTPVFYAPSKKLLWHNENSFNYSWPLHIMFACAQPAEQGGETPLVDSRRLFERLPAFIREAFVDRQVMYVRTYGDQLGKTWQELFGTQERAEIEKICQANYMDYEWLPDGRLQTKAVRPAAIKHPRSGEMSWFNQAQHWHVACLGEETRQTLSQLYSPELMPRNCYFGDGTVIPDEMILEILGCYEALEVSFPWQQGDALIVDNVLLAHGRNPFIGQRKLLVALSDMYTF